MGREARCSARFAGRTVAGRAQLEGDVVLFRGEDVRVRVPLAEVSTADAHDGWLRVVWGSEALELELGAQAGTWAERVRNPRSLLDRLGVKEGMRVAVVRLEDADGLSERVRERGAVPIAGRAVRGADLVLFEARSRADLGRLAALRRSLVPDGGIWVVWRRGDPSVGEPDVRSAAKAAGLVDVKVVRWSETRTALKLVIPVAERGSV